MVLASLIRLDIPELSLIAATEFELLDDGVAVVLIEGGMTPELVEITGFDPFG